MQVNKDMAATEHIHDHGIRTLVQQRIRDLGIEFDAGTMSYFLVVEPGDTLNELHTQLGFSIVANRFTGIRYDQKGFTPSFEFVERIGNCFDMVFVLSDDGFAVEVFVPNTQGVDADLLAMCERYAFTDTKDSAHQ